MQVWEYKFETLLGLLGTLPGIIGILLAITLSVLAVVNPRIRWFCLIAMLWSTTFYEPTDTLIRNSLAFPLQVIRNYNVILGFAFTALLVLAALAAPRGWRSRIPPAVLIAYFLFQVIVCIQGLFQADGTRSLLGLIIYTFQFLVLAIGLSRWIQDDKSARGAILCLGCLGFLVAMSCLYQVMIDHGAVVNNRRFYGTTGNPQHQGQILGITFPVLCYLLVSKESNIFIRIAAAVAIGLNCIFLAWTGSRTAALIATVGILLLFRTRIWRLSLAVIAGGITLYAGIAIFGENVQSADRLLDISDTRTHAWKNMWRAFVNSPWIGGQLEQFAGIGAGSSENSFLMIAGRNGLVGLIPLLVLTGFLIRQAIHLQKAKPFLGEQKLAADLVVACFFSALVGSMFDPFLIGQFNTIVFSIFILGSVGGYLEDLADYNRSLMANGYEIELTQVTENVEAILPDDYAKV